MKKLQLILLIVSITAFVGCDIADNEATPTASFFKIYDNNLFDASYSPIDIIQTEDGGYIVLSASSIGTSNFMGIKLLKIDEEGNFGYEINLSEDYVFPVDQLIKIDKQYYFMAMNATNLQSTLFTLNDSAKVKATTPIAGLNYPLYLNQDDGNLISLSYNNIDKTSVIALLNTSGQIINNQAYDIGAGSETEAPIIEHFARTGRTLPFFAGRTTDGNYYFNGFYNYTMSLAFTAFGDEPLGVVQGQQDDGGLSAAISISESTFAASKFNFGDNYILPNINFQPNGLTNIADFAGNPFPELLDNAHVELELIEQNQTSYVIYGSSTKSGQIVLMAYEASSGRLMGTKYLGSSNPYTIAGLHATIDGGLVVLGTTAVAGRFDRICIFKLSADELSDLVN